MGPALPWWLHLHLRLHHGSSSMAKLGLPPGHTPLPLTGSGTGEPCCCQLLPCPALPCRQHSIAAYGKRVLCLPVDIQALALAVNPTTSDCHREYLHHFAQHQHSSLNARSTVKILANLQRAFFFFQSSSLLPNCSNFSSFPSD